MQNLYPILLLYILGSYAFPLRAYTQPISTNSNLELNYLAPDSYQIEAIHVTGMKLLDPETIIAIAGLQHGDIVQLPGTAIKAALHRLWKQKLIKDVAIYATKVVGKRLVLTIDITESARLSHYFFEGIKKQEKKELQKQISLVTGEIITEELIKNTKQTIEKYWISQGFLNIVVNITSLPDPALADYAQLKISIDKGEKFCINEILIEGNQRIRSHILKRQMQHTRERPRFTLVKDLLKHTLTLRPLRKGGVLRNHPSLKDTYDYIKEHSIFFPSKFIQSKYQEDKKRIIDFYQQEGFQDAKIVEEAICKRADGLLDVRLKIAEGKQYLIRNIKWVGNYRYSDAMLDKILGIEKGAIYNPVRIQQKLQVSPGGDGLGDLYMNNGYLFFHAELVEVGITGNEVDVAIRIQEGPQPTINQVFIEGNTITHDHVIRRELKTLPGDKFNLAKVKRSLRELAMMELFAPEKLAFTPIPNPEAGTVDLKYQVVEKPRFLANLSGSWGGSEHGIIGRLGFGVNNFSLGKLLPFKWPPLGDGQTFNLKVESNGKEYKNYAMQFIEPWLGGKKPMMLSIMADRSYQALPADAHRTFIERITKTAMLPRWEFSPAAGFIQSWGVKIGFGTRLKWPDDYFIVRSALILYQHHYSQYSLLEDKKKISGRVHDFHIDASIERNSTNSTIYPTEGSIVALHASITPPYSLFVNKDYNTLPKQEKYAQKEYHKWMLDSSWFIKLIGNLVLNLRGNVGLLGGFNAKLGIGPFERFFLGGMQPQEKIFLLGKEEIDLRGYEDGCITPKDKEVCCLGGTIYNKFVCELHYPIVLSSLVSIYVLGFAEAGNNWLREDYNPLDLKKSVGIGIRFNSSLLPFPQIGLDWGYGLDPVAGNQPTSNTLKFHFSIGTNRR